MNPLPSEHHPGRWRIARPVARLRQGRADWFRIKNLGAVDRHDGKGFKNVAELYIYDEIGYFGVTAADLVDQLKTLAVDELDVHINSPGGDVFDGLAIYNALREHKATVSTYVDSLAASIASVIAMAGEHRAIAKIGTMMVHDGHGLVVGNAADMREMADLLDKTSNTIAGVYADAAGGDLEEWRDRMRAETWYDAEEAKAAGLVDEVRDAGTKDTPEGSWDLSIFSYAGRRQAPAPPAQPAVPRIAANVEPVFAFDPDLFKTAVTEVYR